MTPRWTSRPIISPILVWVPLYRRTGLLPQATTTASVPVPVAPGDPVQLGTFLERSTDVLLSVATCTAPTSADEVKRAFVTRMMLIVPRAGRA